jgi:hypothetical protein
LLEQILLVADLFTDYWVSEINQNCICHPRSRRDPSEA